MPDIRTFFIPGTTVPKQRPRFSKKMGRAYTPAKTTHAEGAVKLFYKQAYPDAPLLTGPIALTVVCLYPTPTKPRWLAEWVAQKSVPYRGASDWDNLGKLVSDALNKVAWDDDRQIWMACVVKRYCMGNEVPGTRIIIIDSSDMVPTKE